MKKLAAIILALSIAAGRFTACSGGASVKEVGKIDGVSEEVSAMLEDAGIDLDEFGGMSAEQQQAILDELGIKEQGKQENEEKQEQTSNTKPTVKDVMAGGNYVVTVGDSMMWNYFTLYYEDGVLVRIETSFRKTSEEEPEEEVIEGDAIADYSLFFIDYDTNAADVVNALNNQGYTQVYISKAE